MQGALWKGFQRAKEEIFNFFAKNCRNILQIKFFVLSLQCQRTTGAADTAAKMKKEMEKLNYTTREINRNFKIKVSGQFEGHKIHTLVGVTGLLKVVGDVALTNRLLDRAFNTMNDVEVCRLRRGVKISFYAA